MLDRSSEVPLWVQLASRLRTQIAEGRGGRFPTEHELVELYGVSRHTVREALRDLRASGLIERHRGLGTFIAKPVLEQPLRTMYSIAPSVARYGERERSSVLQQGLVHNESAARALGLRPREEVVELERLRFVDDEPVMLVRSWYGRALGRALLAEDLTERSVYEVLATALEIRVTGGSERISAAMPTSDERALLGLARDGAVLRVERVALAGETPIEYRLSIVRGDRFAFVAEWLEGTPQGRSQGAR